MHHRLYYALSSTRTARYYRCVNRRLTLAPLQIPPTVHVNICPRRTAGPSKSSSMSSTHITPATHNATAIPTQVTFTSTTASVATTMTPRVSHNRLSALFIVSHGNSALTSIDTYALSMIVGCQEYGNENDGRHYALRYTV